MSSEAKIGDHLHEELTTALLYATDSLCSGFDKQIYHSEIYFLSFERSELEGKYSLIVSVYACMHCVWEIIVCHHSGDAGLCVYVACMDGLAQLVGI